MKFKLNLRPCKVLFSIVLLSSLQLCVAFAQMGKTANASPSDLHSERWPKHTVRILVGFPAGSTPDMIARTIAEPLSKSLGQAVIVENHVGVSGNLAAQLVAHAQDDHTLGLMINGNLTTAKLLYPSLDFDPLKDFSLISLIADSPLVLVAPANLPSGKAFLATAQTQGNHWNYGSVGTGSMAHLAMEALKASNPGLLPEHIPYPGNPAVMSALMAGEIQMALVPIGVATPLIHSEKIQAIGLLGSKSILAPALVPLSELGVKGGSTQLQVWDALVGPKSLSRDAQSRLERELNVLLQSNELRGQLFNQGWILRGTNKEALKNIINPEYLLMQGLIDKNKIHITP
jgi:tripartite-type tricarboxylate transporter receptor subunit TctC